MTTPKELALKGCDAALTTAVQSAIGAMFATYLHIGDDAKRDTYRADAEKRLAIQLAVLSDAYKSGLDIVVRMFTEPEPSVSTPAQRERRKTG